MCELYPLTEGALCTLSYEIAPQRLTAWAQQLIQLQPARYARAHACVHVFVHVLLALLTLRSVICVEWRYAEQTRLESISTHPAANAQRASAQACLTIDGPSAALFTQAFSFTSFKLADV